MSFRSYLIFMTLASVCAWIAWVVVLHGVDPARSGSLGFVLFYFTLAMAVFGTLSLAGLLVRMWKNPDALPSRSTLHALRQGVLLTVLILSSLMLFSQGWFRWWTMLLLIIIVALLELLLIVKKTA